MPIIRLIARDTSDPHQHYLPAASAGTDIGRRIERDIPTKTADLIDHHEAGTDIEVLAVSATFLNLQRRTRRECERATTGQIGIDAGARIDLEFGIAPMLIGRTGAARDDQLVCLSGARTAWQEIATDHDVLRHVDGQQSPAVFLLDNIDIT